MPLYTVFAPPPRTGETAPDPVRFVFVKDGFCWPALFVPELWLLFRRMWLVFVLYVAAVIGLGVLSERFGGPLPWVALALGHLLFALEGNTLRRRKLASRGYDFIGVVEGRRREVETRFFAQWQPPDETAPPADAAPPPPETASTVAAIADAARSEPARPSVEAGEVVGLFPAPGGTS